MGHFGNGKFLIVVEKEGIALRRGERLHDLAKALAKFIALHHFGGLFSRLFPLLALLYIGLVHGLVPILILAEVIGHRVEPRGKGLSRAILLTVNPHPDEKFLHHILGLGGVVSEHAEKETAKPSRIPII
jgi:hypothetical protein